MAHADSSVSRHVPVMRDEVMGILRCHPGGRYVDGTVGGGGYGEAILESSGPDGVLLGLDWDADAIVRVTRRLARFGGRMFLEKASFSEMACVLNRLGWGAVDGVVLDLGISSYQLEDPERGFSFLGDGPLDMRMDLDLPLTAADLVNSLPEKELADLIYGLGEERWSRRIARAIVSDREREPFSTTGRLAEVVAKAVPRSRDTRRIHPATRTFQALRLAVNRELDVLQDFLAQALDILKPEGRLCIVAFHSLEDRIVKSRFRQWAKSCRCPESVVPCRCEGRPLVRLLTRKALRPSQEEVDRNPRARSARLRAVEKI